MRGSSRHFETDEALVEQVNSVHETFGDMMESSALIGHSNDDRTDWSRDNGEIHRDSIEHW